VEPEETAVVRQRLRKDIRAATIHNNRRIAGRDVSYAVLVFSDTQYVVKGKQTIFFFP
jgi:hypothetical protein